MCGWSFSGKTHLAKLIANKTGAEIISLDIINVERGFDGNAEIPVVEWEKTHKIALEKLEKYLSLGKSVIIDDTNPLIKLRDRFRKVAIQKKVETVVVFIKISKEEVEKRIKEVRPRQDRHIAPDMARENLIKIFEIPNPNAENTLIYNSGDNTETWIIEKID